MCQMLVTDDKAANLQKARQAIASAANDGAELVSLPECFNSPYATDQFPIYAEPIPSDLFDDGYDPETIPSSVMLRDAAKEHGIYLIGGSIPERDGDKVYNTCLVVGPDGKAVAKHRKVHLFDIDIPGKQRFKESDTLTGGDAMSVFTTPFATIGLAICYDLRFPELA